MKRFILLSFTGLLLLTLAGCSLQENYSVQYGFTNEVTTETKLNVTSGGMELQTPFADFSCDTKSFKADVSRQNDTFTVLLSGNETTERCTQKFFLSISGVQSGTYWIKVIYRKAAGEEQQVVYQQFKVN